MSVRRDSATIGKAPAGATHWSMRRKGQLAWEQCTHGSPQGTLAQEFPLADLSLATIRTRWGPGTYRVSFLVVARGSRQVVGNGKTFEVSEPARAGDEGKTPEDHSHMVRALLRAAEGKHQPEELFEALAIPLGMALSSLFTLQDRMGERLEALERRLALLEDRLNVQRAPEADASPMLGRILEKLDAMERRLTPPTPAAPAARRDSPAGGPRRDSPGERRRKSGG